VLGAPHVSALYLDDQMSGNQVVNNTFINAQQGVLVGGGRDNTVLSGNYVERCDIVVQFDNRGQIDVCALGGKYELDLQSCNYQSDPWASAYPETVHTFDELPCTPQYNVISNNYCETEQFDMILPVITPSKTMWSWNVKSTLAEKCLERKCTSSVK
jgi:parallel beta-helix repeat protein